MPECEEPLYETGEDGQPMLNSRVAHICARREGGPRWDSQMTSEENRSESNLVLMCIQHAAHIDDAQRRTEYTVDVLRQMKIAQRVAEGGGTAITDEEAAAIIRESFTGDTVIDAAAVQLGGQGGTAPGAGGGGGGAVGPGARGGQGGQGGEIRTGWFRAGDLPDVVPIRVGRGGRGSETGEGEDGEDTSFGPLVARGGLGGRAGLGPLEDELTEARVTVSTAMLADAISIRGGLMTIAHGGWSTYRPTHLPAECRWPLAVLVDIEDAQSPGILRLTIVVEGPPGDTRCEDEIRLTISGDELVARRPAAVGLRFTIADSGRHVVRIAFGDLELAHFDVMVEPPGAT